MFNVLLFLLTIPALLLYLVLFLGSLLVTISEPELKSIIILISCISMAYVYCSYFNNKLKVYIKRKLKNVRSNK